MEIIETVEIIETTGVMEEINIDNIPEITIFLDEVYIHKARLHTIS